VQQGSQTLLMRGARLNELVHFEVRDRVATITLDSPDNRNALSAQLVEELLAHLHAVGNAHVVVLTHTGPAFCAGADLKSRGAPIRLAELLNTLWTLPQPVVARVGGHARAGGVGIVAACDLSVASSQATFAFSEVRLGVTPAIISVVCLPRLRHADALELFLTGEPVDAARAAAAGLVTAVADDVDAALARYVAQLRLGAPRALDEAKRLVRGPLDFAAMERLSAELFASEDAREGIAAFFEKRPPAWAQ
jgi:methylglutaconyl-CoA hydratase